ncbi:MAG: M20/M25/M40 family metallo-hydrolase [Bacteroidetes bacterium]|nr:M20/M25/M40 family metallo-hydrolase [Bacteroidota bacterium]MBU1114083.1 M20/M25/M40 family metallo-hydrolase [Bacteroidota bacterium]MBU1798869.1 M20/M25/M40 family metallo-hydrolase [Bacteroidota bacterium]
MIKKILLFLSIALVINAQTNLLHHEISAVVEPSNSFISVVDEITIPQALIKNEMKFKLFSGLIVEENSLIKKLNETENAEDIGMDKDDVNSASKLILNVYQINIPSDCKGDFKLEIKYNGKIESPVEQSEENYARGFSESPGIIWEKGVYLAGSTYWVPYFDDGLLTFNLTTTTPKEWKTVSVGTRTIDKINEASHIDKWESLTPQEEVFLIAAPFTEYSFSMGSIEAMAFLRTPDEGLANKYLETTAQYMEMYRKLVGPYPYTKFALVENFWETGYGMPSFTLLGEKIIRFPFILHSSYPHELLHNWWGNSVYVDFTKGNWCEGITAYMADHLIKEQREQAVEYRRATLQKFTNYVTPKNDFPLNKFLSRHDEPSEAIGYGKSSMFFHMLRRKVGDELFTKGFQTFNRENKFKRASFDDIRIAFEEATEQDLKWFFDQWITRTGAPKIILEDVKTKSIRDFNNVSFTLKQIQDEDVFYVDVPVTLVTENGTITEIFQMNEKEAKFNFTSKEKPIQILVDAQFDLFRKLDPKETPPTFTELYGAQKTLVLLPSSKQDLYKNFITQWIKGDEDKFEIKNDSEVNELPTENAVLLLGLDNKFAPLFSNQIANYNSEIGLAKVILEKIEVPTENTSFLLTAVNPKNLNEVIALLSIGNEKAIDGLVRKLPHYGKYSYLAFTGDEPTNSEKGQWPVVSSPLSKVLDAKMSDIKVELEKRKPLATLEPVFSAERMMETIKYLSSDEMIGRGIDSPEIEKAIEYIKSKFEEYGLLPGADNGTYYQTWEQDVLNKKNIKLKNIIGIIPGADPEIKDAPLVISAHYDHLGLGWPDVRKGNEGKIHNGADDNASGIAVMLELIKTTAKSLNPARTVIFVAFTAEEAGLIGSRYFTNNYKKYPIEKIIANLNLDSVGRLFDKKLIVLNSNSAREWKFIFMGTEYTTGIATELSTQDLDASDQVAFLEKGIPAVQFFVGPNEDYHRPTDTFEKIDPSGLVKTATVVKETFVYLADRKEPMTFTGKAEDIIPSAKIPKGQIGKSGKKTATGFMPDFAFSGEGVKVGAVSEESPAETAGILKGDIIKIFDGHEVKDLKIYTKYLYARNPGDKVKITIERNGELKEVELILKER